MGDFPCDLGTIANSGLGGSIVLGGFWRAIHWKGRFLLGNSSRVPVIGQGSGVFLGGVRHGGGECPGAGGERHCGARRNGQETGKQVRRDETG